jgi:glycosyltransferase involved in cell wall biosynthesis
MAHVEKPLYKVVDSKLHSVSDEKIKSLYCFIPWNQDSYQYSYLLYEQEKEMEYRESCFRSLKRRDAFLTHPVSSLICPHQRLKAPLISIVIPLFNRSQFIGKAIDSVLKNTWKNFEIIIVDNGSSDDSVEVVKSYMRGKNIRLFSNDRNNIARALNLGVKMAKGKYICELGSDDLYTPKTLEILFSYMESNPNCALGVSYYDRIGPYDEPLPDFGVIKHSEYDRNNLIRTDGVGAARIWHRCILEELGGFDEDNLGNYGEDYDLQLKVSEKYEILRIPLVLYHYRKHSENTDKTIDFKTRHFKKNPSEKSGDFKKTDY